MPEKILVTPRSVTRDGHPSLEKLREAGYEVIFCTPGAQPGEVELLRLLPDCVGYLAGVEKVTAQVLTAAKNLRAISRNGTGINNIDLDAAREKGIRVLKTDGANARGVAELTFGLMLSLARSIPFSDRSLKTGGWERRKGVELEGRTLGLIGCGKIGKIVARMALSFGMRVLAYDPYPDTSFAPSDEFEFAPIEKVIAEADFLSLHCPALSGQGALINADSLARMKSGAFLINTARAELMDWEAVRVAHESGRLAGVAVDAYAEEPPSDRALIGNDRAIATPHVGALTEESVGRAMTEAVDNLLKALAE